MIGAVILARAQRRELLSRDSRRSEKTHPIKLLFWDGTGLWLCSKRLENDEAHEETTSATSNNSFLRWLRSS
jgi:hypothetical protein